ncbi:MAG: hypothetical protein JXA33_27835 [Anaerolineae bacterium]|nr:hypothetical protein [Anaerolineae bacterium]
MLTAQELQEVKEYVLRELPQILEQDPKFVIFIEGIVNEKFPRRDEFARLLDELTALRLESERSFRYVDQRFEQVDQRFEQVDQRFEQVDQRFEQVDQRFEQVDQRFEQVDQRFVRLTQEVRESRNWFELLMGRWQTRAGRDLENVVAGALRLGLNRRDILPENVKLRQLISDPTGIVYKPGKQKEVDLIAQNGELLVFEVKSSPDVDDVDNFADKVKLVKIQNPDKEVCGVFVALTVDPRIRERCHELDLILIPELYDTL